MREIKFRVINAGMVIAYEYLNQFGWFHVLLNNNTHYSGCFPDVQFGHKERCDRDQYTGLKDKNGKEIYEGDIVESKEGVFTVEEWGDGVYRVVSDGMTWDWLFQLKSKGYLEYGKGNYEIIGNIYENPELVNQKQETY